MQFPPENAENTRKTGFPRDFGPFRGSRAIIAPCGAPKRVVLGVPLAQLHAKSRLGDPKNPVFGVPGPQNRGFRGSRGPGVRGPRKPGFRGPGDPGSGGPGTPGPRGPGVPGTPVSGVPESRISGFPGPPGGCLLIKDYFLGGVPPFYKGSFGTCEEFFTRFRTVCQISAKFRVFFGFRPISDNWKTTN